MIKYNEPIFNKKYIQEAFKISLWERFLLLFVPRHRFEDEETICHFKYLGGKFYLLDFKVKGLNDS